MDKYTKNVDYGEIAYLKAQELEKNLSKTRLMIDTIQYAESSAITDDVNSLKTRANNLESTTSQLSSTVGGLSSSMSTLQGDVAGLDSDMSGLDSRVTTLESSMDTAESSINTLNSDISTINTSIGAIEDDIESLESSVSDAASSVVRDIYYFYPYDQVTQKSNKYTLEVESSAGKDVSVRVEVGIFNLSQDDDISLKVDSSENTITESIDTYAARTLRTKLYADGVLNNRVGTESISIALSAALASTTYTIEYIKVTLMGEGLKILSNRRVRYMITPRANGKLLVTFSCDKRIRYVEIDRQDLALFDYKTLLVSTRDGYTNLITSSVAKYLNYGNGFKKNTSTQQYENYDNWLVQYNDNTKYLCVFNMSTGASTNIGASNTKLLTYDFRPLKSNQYVFELVTGESIRSIFDSSLTYTCRMNRYNTTARAQSSSIKLSNTNIQGVLQDVCIAHWVEEPVNNYQDTIIFIVVNEVLGLTDVFTNANGTKYFMTDIPCDKVRAFQLDADTIEVYCHYDEAWTKYVFTRNAETMNTFDHGTGSLCSKNYDDIVYIDSNMVVYVSGYECYTDSRSNFVQ